MRESHVNKRFAGCCEAGFFIKPDGSFPGMQNNPLIAFGARHIFGVGQ